MNLLMLKGFSLEYLPTGIPQAWSLTVEECFYAFAIFFFICLNSNKRHRVAIWLAVIVLIPMTGVLLVEICHRSKLPLLENLAFTVSYSFFGRFSEFLFGVGLAIVLQRAKYIHRIPMLTYTGVILFAFGIYTLMQIKNFYHVNYGTSHPLGVIVNNLYLPVGICIIFTGLIKERTIISTILASKFFSILGRSSYALYLIHISFIQVVLLSFFNIKTIPGALAMLVSLLVIALALHYFVEEPTNRKIRLIASRWLTPTSSSSTFASSKATAR
jgi:peptidoglycan/LPS O-acetylase OafA/YrhL